MIEYLALAAEVTAFLLIISITYPGSTANHRKAGNEPDLVGNQATETLRSIQEPLQEIRLLVFQAAAQQYSRHASASDWLQCDAHREITKSLSQMMTLVQELDEDLATRLPTMESMRGFFKNLHPLQQRHEIPMQIATLTVDHWSDLVNQHGQVVAERLLRELATLFSSRFSLHGIVVRYSEYTFAIGFVGLPEPEAIDLLEAVRQAIFENKIAIGEHEISSSLSIAITKISNDDFDPAGQISDGIWEYLEEATAQAITSGGNRIHGNPESTKSFESKAELSSPSTVKSVDAPPPVSSPIPFADEKPKPTLTEAEPTSVVAPVPTFVAPAKSDAPGVAIDGSASADDIASLFAKMKKPTPKKQADVAESKPESIATLSDIESVLADHKQKPSASDEVTEESLVASIDDINRLFAEAKKKHAVKPSAINTIKENLETKNLETEVLSKPVAATVDSTSATHGAVTADDIESLFAAMKK